MNLLSFDVDARRQLVAPGTAWSGLADSLAADLEPLLDRDLPIPDIKARLTRIGGRCTVDGQLLRFHPFAPHEHECPLCGAVYRRQEDFEWWAMGAHLYAAERAVHGAALYVLRGNEQHRQLALDILARYTDLYLSYPNKDNVLGPSRPFFSTYLESIWLLNLCHAVVLLEGAAPTGAQNSVATNSLSQFRERVVEPSVALISGFHEGRSNRQVWNEVAILSAHRMLGATTSFEHRAHSSHGLLSLADEGLQPDGTWYEGENYHLFAQRGLWYGCELLRAAHMDIGAERTRRYLRAFETPFVGLLPDGRFPSRRDSPYRVSVRQWRYAEWCELALTAASAFRADGGDTMHASARDSHEPSRTLTSMLEVLYDGTVERRDTERWRSTADAERNVPPSALTRADCSWRALLVADAREWWTQRHANERNTSRTASRDLDGGTTRSRDVISTGSVLLPSTGLAVVRREGGSVYVSLEGGESGGGHGHPDRLALALQVGDYRYLDDPGAGSYVDRSLHWYRSTLAHHAPLVDRRSQAPGVAELLAWDERGGTGWVVKRAEIAPGVVVIRSVIVVDGYLIDRMEWTAPDSHEITLPVCGPAVVDEGNAPLEWRAETTPAPLGLEDGFDFATDIEVAAITSHVSLKAFARTPSSAPHATLHVAVSHPALLVRATVPNAPGLAATQRHWLRCTAPSGAIVSCWSWHERGLLSVEQVVLDAANWPCATVTTGDGTTATHTRTEQGWRIDLTVGAAQSSIDLDLLPPPRHLELPAVDKHVTRAITLPFEAELGREHYRRTEQTWNEAGEPTASVRVDVTDSDLVVEVRCTKQPVVPTATAPNGIPFNPLDNERADVNADGVQVYVGTTQGEPWTGAWLCVPSIPPRITSIVGGDVTQLEPAVTVSVMGNAWRMYVRIPRAILPVADRIVFDLIVNERPSDRERRRGQLVLSGGGGFAYLRGDRQESDNAVTLTLPHSPQLSAD